MYAYIETEFHRQQQRDPSKCIILWVHLYIEQQIIINVNLLKQIGTNTNDETGEKQSISGIILCMLFSVLNLSN